LSSFRFKLDASDSRIGTSIRELVGTVSRLTWRSFVAKTPHERTTIKRQIEAANRDIDHLVYELHGLSDTETELVEGTTQAITVCAEA
jgi:hypothetical protein